MSPRGTRAAARPGGRVEARARAGGDRWILPLLAGVLAVWLLETGGSVLWRTSHWDQYVYLADAFVHGQLHLFHHPADAGDMAIVQGRAYVVFGPLPALPLMALVPFLGPRTPDVLVLVLTALFGIFAFARFLAALPEPPDAFRRAMATLTFALGTAIHYGAPMGNVWLHAQITATALQCWGLWMAARGRPGWSGLAFALTVLTRSTVTLALPAAAWLLASRRAEGSADARRRWIVPGLALVLPVIAAAGVHALYNLARFGSPADAGYHYILMGENFQGLIARYGRFSLHFLPHNLAGWLLALPRLEPGALVPDGHGMSLLLTTPFLFLLLWPRRPRALEWVLLANVVVIAAPALLYYNDGWIQFGQRFALDWMALALAAAALASRRAPAWLVAALTAFGIAVNAWGTLWFQATAPH